MQTAALLFLALLSIYVAASGRAKKILEALGANVGDAAAVADTSGQGTPEGTQATSNDLLTNNAAMYNTKLTNPGSLNSNTNNPAYQTNYGLPDMTSLTGGYDAMGQLQQTYQAPLGNTGNLLNFGGQADPTSYGMGPVQRGGGIGTVWNASSYGYGSAQQVYPQYFSSIAGL